MKLVCVDFAARQVASITKPTAVITINEYTIIIKTHSTFKDNEVTFKLRVEFSESGR